MLKALLSKQLLEVTSFYFMDRRTGKRRSSAGIIGYIILFGFVFLSCGLAFFGMASIFSDAFIPAGLDWLYFAMFAPIAIIAGSFLDMFIASTSLFRAKDNDLLLSMPIPPRDILLVRMLGLYIWGFLYESIIFIPVILRYWVVKPLSAEVVIFPLLVYLLCTVTTLSLSCILGWITAKITARLKNKSFTTVLLALLLIGLYYVVYFRMNSLLQSAVENMGVLSGTIRKYLFPIYHLGLGASGNVSSFFLTAGLTIGFFALVYLVLSKNFIKTATANYGGKKAVYKESEQKESGLTSSLIRRELIHFSNSPAYMLNTGLGILILPIAGIALILNRAKITPALAQIIEENPSLTSGIPFVLALICCLGLTMNSFAGPSVSLEAKTLWILKTLPVRSHDVLYAKIRVHVLLNVIPAIVFPILAGISFGVGIPEILGVIGIGITFAMVTARLGVIGDVKHPILDWANETVPIKQGIGVLLSIFGGWGIAFVFSALSGLTVLFLNAAPLLCQIIVIALQVILCRLLDRGISDKGEKKFEELC